MSREIKFRAWGAERKEMLDDIDLLDWKAETLNNPGDGWTVMQYTGLKDKNGAEIYEGDIVEDSNFGQREKWWGVVVWNLVGFQVSFHKPTNKTWTDLAIIYDSPLTKWKIIGNIWENPELLK